MTQKTLRSGLWILTLVVLAGPILQLAAAPAHSIQAQSKPEQPPAPAKRLRLTVGQTTVTEGGTTPVTVDFLDRYYNPVPNDEPRKIKLRAESYGDGGGSGRLDPAERDVPAGAWSTQVSFTARKAGRVRIKASFDGLEDAKYLVSVALRPRRGASVLSRLFDFTVYAEPERRISVDLLDQDQLIANRVSPVALAVTLFGEVHDNESVVVDISTDPPCGMKLDDPRAMKRDDPRAITENGHLQVSFGKDENLKNFIVVSPPQTGTVTVAAQIRTLPFKQELKLDFKPQFPKSIFFADGNDKEVGKTIIFSNDEREPLRMRLADERKVAIEQVDRKLGIQLSSQTRNDYIEFKPDSVMFAPGSKLCRSTLILKKIPKEEIRLMAAGTDPDVSLEPGRLTVATQNPIEGVKITGGQKEVNPDNQYSLKVQLVDTAKAAQKSDQDRRVELIAERGELMLAPEGQWASAATVTFARGDITKEVQYRAPASVGADSISTQSDFLLPDSLEMKVVVAGFILLLFAGLGGTMGGILRHVYKDGVTHILPAWVNGRLETGLVGNATLSIVIGVFLFLAANVGLVSVTNFQATQSWAFILGVLGGFGGIYVLQKVLGYIFPEQRPV